MPEVGKFIREKWYPASWSDQLGRTPIARKFLHENIVLYRRENGDPVALAGVCPHRFALLSKGRLHGDELACPYHGLRFSPEGQCVHNPHGPAPKSVQVHAYPLTERYGMVWIWMGEAANADPSLLPSIPSRENAAYDFVTGHLQVSGNYQLVIDNLLDLTHVEFMHPFLAAEAQSETLKVVCREEGEEVISIYNQSDVACAPIVSALWDEAPKHISLAVEMRWNAPANLVQNSFFDMPGQADIGKGHLELPFCHLLTPETHGTTHYFWAAGRNAKLGIPPVSEAIAAGIVGTFAGEDEPMIADIQEHIGGRDLFELKPLLLSIDKSAVLARRRVARVIEEEQRSSVSR